jgi:hypothetical protein
MTIYKGSGGIVPLILNPVARCSVNTALRPLYPTYPFSKRIGSPQAAVPKIPKTEKIPRTCRDLNPSPPSPQPNRYTNYTIPVFKTVYYTKNAELLETMKQSKLI